MNETNLYEIVRQNLKLGALYTPKHEKVYELLKIFWNEEEINILSHFESADKSISLRELEKRTGIPKQEIKRILSRPLEKGTLGQRGTKYFLLPILPGIFEKYFINRSDTEENLKKAAEIYRYLFKEFLPQLYRDNRFKLFRPLLPLDSKEKLIDIDKSFDVQSQVLPYEIVNHIIDSYDKFSVIPCQCRLIGEYTGEPCQVASPDLGCFLAGNVAQSAIDAGLPNMSKEDAREFLKKTEKAGLIHSCIADNSIESSLFICNCCSCHCGVFSTAKDHKYHAAITSNYIPQINDDICTKCETCMKKCQMGAIFHIWPDKGDSSDDHIEIRNENCIGCGVCATNCPNNAIKMVKVRNNSFQEKHKIGNRTFFELLM